MDAVRMVSRSERPFDVSKLVYLHCIDLSTEKFEPVTNFACLEVCYVLGHFSFPSELAVRRICCLLWSDDCNRKLSLVQSPVLLNVTSSCYFTDPNGRNIAFILNFDVVGRQGISVLPRPKSMKELENEVDHFKDCCPILDLDMCRCNCTEYPKRMKVLLADCTDRKNANSESDSACYSPVFEESSDEEENPEFAEVIANFDEDNIEEPCEFSDETDDENIPMFTEYVALRGSSFHSDCQSTLKKCREILAGKGAVELRLEPEPGNIRDSNAIIMKANVDSQWDRIGYIPKEKIPKFTSALNNDEIKDMKFKTIKCQFIMTDSPKWTYFASVLVTKTGRWLPNDGNYKYNDKL